MKFRRKLDNEWEHYITTVLNKFNRNKLLLTPFQ